MYKLVNYLPYKNETNMLHVNKRNVTLFFGKFAPFHENLCTPNEAIQYQGN